MTQALPDWTEGTTHIGLTITWLDGDGAALNLTGATLTGRIKDLATGTARNIAGTLALVTAASGIFSWTMDAADVVAGVYHVQFTATFASNPARTFRATWRVEAAI